MLCFDSKSLGGFLHMVPIPDLFHPVILGQIKLALVDTLLGKPFLGGGSLLCELMSCNNPNRKICNSTGFDLIMLLGVRRDWFEC